MTRTWPDPAEIRRVRGVMALLTAALFAVFGEYRGGSTANYSAVFTDVSDLQAGDSVRVGGNPGRHSHRRVAAP